MKDLTSIKKILIVQNSNEVNKLLDEGWTLLELGKIDDSPLFVLGLDAIHREYESFLESVSNYEGTY